MALSDDLLDATVRHQIWLERHKAGVVKEVLKIVNKTTDAAAAEVARERVERLTRRQADALLARIRARIKSGYEPAIEFIDGEIDALAVEETRWQQRTLRRMVPIRIDWESASDQQIIASVHAQPFNGKFLKEWEEGLGDGAFRRVRTAVLEGYVQGMTTPEIVAEVRKITDKASESAATTMVRTAMTHASNVARRRLYERHASVIKAVQWVSTLDARTSLVCMGRDGKTWPPKTGPRPPAHPRCRSTTIPVLRSSRALEKRGIKLKDVPAKRASMNGAIAAKTTYNDFLRRQDAGFQDSVLGEDRARLFRAGLKVDKFTDKAGNEITLRELRRRHPEVWAQAFGDGEPPPKPPPGTPPSPPPPPPKPAPKPRPPPSPDDLMRLRGRVVRERVQKRMESDSDYAGVLGRLADRERALADAQAEIGRLQERSSEAELLDVWDRVWRGEALSDPDSEVQRAARRAFRRQIDAAKEISTLAAAKSRTVARMFREELEAEGVAFGGERPRMFAAPGLAGGAATLDKAKDTIERYMPRAFIEAQNRLDRDAGTDRWLSFRTSSERSHYSSARQEIVTDAPGTATTLHEYAHALQDRFRGVDDPLVRAFWRKVAGEKRREIYSSGRDAGVLGKISQAQGDAGYADDLVDLYAGKTYLSREGREWPQEVWAMMAQAVLMGDAQTVRQLARDPDLVDVFLGILVSGPTEASERSVMRRWYQGVEGYGAPGRPE